MSDTGLQGDENLVWFSGSQLGVILQPRLQCLEAFWGMLPASSG